MPARTLRVVFAIHDPGYGSDHFTPFREVFAEGRAADG